MTKKTSGWLALPALLLSNVSSLAQTPQAVLQRGYDANVSGANLSETTLTTSNISVNSFGQLFTLPVDDVIFAQPLYVPNVAIAGQGTHNVIYVVTMSDTLFAFDADAGGELWSVNFASAVGESPVDFDNFSYAGAGKNNIIGNMGILSTPVIDPSTHILYLVACTLENGTMAYRLHAVDITSGSEPYGPGVLITGSYQGLAFNPRNSTQRTSLTLADNQVVFAFGAVEAEFGGEGVGWVVAYNKRTLQQSGIFASEPAGNGAGVWQSGRPPAVDSQGYVYVFTGNAYGNGYDGVQSFSESAIKLNPANGLSLVDWFTPSAWSTMDNADQDLSSSGPLLVPGTSLLAGGGKTGILYVVNTGNMGHYNASDSQIVQKDSISSHGMNGGPVFWQRSSANGGSVLYNWSGSDTLKAYPFNGSQFATSPSQQGGTQPSWPGGFLALSANGDLPGSGVIWATIVTSGSIGGNPPAPGALYAFDAGNLGNELWDSTQNPGRDGFGDLGKFVPPMVANGKVYLATWSNEVVVYGLLSTLSVSKTSLSFGNEPLNSASAPMSVKVTNTGVVPLSVSSISLSNTSPHPFSQTNNCGSSVAVNGSCTINVVFNPSTLGGATATLSIATGAGTGTQTVALSGTGAAPAYTVSPSSLAFGVLPPNSASAPMPVTVTNTGSLALPITSIALSSTSPQPYSQSNNCGSSVAVGSSCTINVTFDPAAAGAATATLSIQAGGGAGLQNVALSGTGAAPTYTVSASTLAFGNQTVNSPSAPMSVTVTNTGVVALPVPSITLSSTSPQPYSQTNTCGTSVAVGGSCTINVVFDPGSSGASPATLAINAGTSASNVSLSGTGTFQMTLTTSAQTVTAGVPVTLTWSSPANASCTASGGSSGDSWSGALAASGSQSVTESTAGNYSYGLTCSSQGTSASATVGVTVTAAPAPPAPTVPDVTLMASPASVNVGQKVTLSWSSQNAAICVGSGGPSGGGWSASQSLDGSTTVSLESSGMVAFTLTCSAGAKSTVATATVMVASTSGGGGGAFGGMELLLLSAVAMGVVRRRQAGVTPVQ
jgi:Abnormal spindle-like microcephaly-assoc'd, ASPM-SPD-2-Hydin